MLILRFEIQTLFEYPYRSYNYARKRKFIGFSEPKLCCGLTKIKPSQFRGLPGGRGGGKGGWCCLFTTPSVASLVKDKCQKKGETESELFLSQIVALFSANFFRLFSMFLENMVPCFQSRVACRVYPLEGFVCVLTTQ